MRSITQVFGLCFLLVFSMPSLQCRETADYVIVGVGTAGATMAKLLSDDLSTSVIAIHSGDNLVQEPDIKYTKNVAFTVFSSLLGSSFFQTGNSLPQPNGDDRGILWVLGLPEGGASSINAGAWARGTNQVYDQWEAIAGPEWSTTQILNTYIALEKYLGNTTNPSARGFSGPLNVRQVPIISPISNKFSQAISTGTGVPIILDYNDPNTPVGAAPLVQYTQSGANGEFRVSSATAFLNPNVMTPKGIGVGGRKLKVKFKSRALRTIWKGTRAIGVEYFINGKIKKAYANKGVIVCGGLHSSAFLMHSGVGPRNVLQPLGIPVIYDNPNVGQNLADQPLMMVAFATNPDDTPIANSCGNLPSTLNFTDLPTFLLDIPNTSFQEQVVSAFLCNDYAFPGNSVFSQIAWLPAPAGDPAIRRVLFATVNPIPGLTLALINLVQPLSRGSISINSFNPFIPPVIDYGLFSNPADLDLYVQVFQNYLKNINTAFQLIDPDYELIFPPPEILDDAALVTAFIQEFVTSNQCWQSHCLMAPLNQGGVVGFSGDVYGVQNLYVADDSIVPVPMDGTPMATAYLIAANIARLLLQ